MSFGAAKIIRISSLLNQAAEHENKNRQAQTLLQQPFTCSALRHSLIGNTQEKLINQTPSLKHNNSGLIALLVEDNEINQIVAQMCWKNLA
ncbi:hypothetical protein THIOSC13_1560003 [uncultured Thiomicrorhabdus sp.]